MFEWLCGPMSGCGIGPWLYDYQSVIAGILALGAGIAAYRAGVRQANAAKASADALIAHEKDMSEAATADRVEREVNESLNAIHQLRFEITQLRHFVSIARAQLPVIARVHAQGTRAKAEIVMLRVAKIERLTERSDHIIPQLPMDFSGPVGRLFAWADDICTRCSSFAYSIGGDGALREEIWGPELASIVAGIDQLSAAAGAFLENREEPMQAFTAYIDQYQAVQLNFGAEEAAAHDAANLEHEAEA